MVPTPNPHAKHIHSPLSSISTFLLFSLVHAPLFYVSASLSCTYLYPSLPLQLTSISQSCSCSPEYTAPYSPPCSVLYLFMPIDMISSLFPLLSFYLVNNSDLKEIQCRWLSRFMIFFASDTILLYIHDAQFLLLFSICFPPPIWCTLVGLMMCRLQMNIFF